MGGEHDLTRRRPPGLQPLHRQRHRLPRLPAGVLADGGEVHVGEPRQRAVVIPHDRNRAGHRHAQPGERVEEPDGAAVIGRDHRGRAAGFPGGQHRGGEYARLLGVIAGDDPQVAGEAPPAHGLPVPAAAVRRYGPAAPVDEGDVAMAQAGEVADRLGDAPVVRGPHHVHPQRRAAPSCHLASLPAAWPPVDVRRWPPVLTSATWPPLWLRRRASP